MKTIIRFLTAWAALAMSMAAFASGGGVHLDDAHVNLKDKASLQRGARNFVANCLNCHSAQFMRYSHLTKIGLTEEQIKANLLFNPDTKIGDTMQAAFPAKDAKEWLGTVPPDLTLVTRSRGSDWVYTFLRSFYVDPKSPSGWNNQVFPNTSMPHVLHDLQGTQYMVKIGERVDHGHKVDVTTLETKRAGTLTAQEYDLYVHDLVNFLTFMGEPARVERQQIGIIAMFFLVVAFFAALLLKHEYWKDVK